MSGRTVTTEIRATLVNAGGCAAGCGERARWIVTAAGNGITCVTYACGAHRPEQEVHALRMYAQSVADLLAETRRHDAARERNRDRAAFARMDDRLGIQRRPIGESIAVDALTGLCQRCGSRVALTTDHKIAGHKAPSGRVFCIGGGNAPRRDSERPA